MGLLIKSFRLSKQVGSWRLQRVSKGLKGMLSRLAKSTGLPSMI